MHPSMLPKHKMPLYLDSYFFSNDAEFDYIRAYYHDKELGFPINMHKHNFYEINIIYKGFGYHYIDNQCIEAKEKSVFIIPPNVYHGYYTEDEDNFVVLHVIIHSSFFIKYHDELNNLAGFPFLFEIEPNLRRINQEQFFITLNRKQSDALKPYFSKIVKDHLTNDFSTSERLERIGVVLSLIGHLSDYFIQSHASLIESKEKTKEVGSAFIIETLNYINANYTEKITIEELSKIALMSRASYIRHFEAINGISVNQYITKKRIKEACIMLVKTDDSVTEIAQKCGFYDSSHFSKIFYKIKKRTPKEYREEKRRAIQ